jgi:glycine/D-amino acid oxidase-like deaminating enzyme
LKSREEVAALPERVVFNCTGLGAKALFGDQQLVPVRGQLEVLLPQPEIDYCYLGNNSLYMFPRRDGIILGGSFEQDNQSLEPDAKTTTRIIEGNAEIAKAIRH